MVDAGTRPTLVVGLGRSGRAAARLVARTGPPPLVTDDRGPGDDALPDGATFVSVDDALGRIDGVAEVVVSPGVPADHALLAAARRAGVPVLSEFAFAARHVDAPLVAITGTNGKSTTVTLAGAALAAAGQRTFVGGNLGTPMCDAAGGGFDVVVAEVSSFQLEWPGTVRPAVASILNVTPDHLDRHGSFEAYRDAKLALFARMGAGDAAVLDRDGDLAARLPPQLLEGLSTFGLSAVEPGRLGVHACTESRTLVFDGGDVVRLPAHWPRVRHDYLNAAAAAEVARRAGAGLEAIERAVATFTPLAHRLALVATVGGVEFWNDSKATNVGAAAASVDALESRVVLLAGGQAKDSNFRALAERAARIKLVVAYGESAALVERELAAGVDGPAVVRAGGFDDAVATAVREARSGDRVWLAPACASFDEFANYAERGERFERLVARLAGSDAE